MGVGEGWGGRGDGRKGEVRWEGCGKGKGAGSGGGGEAVGGREDWRDVEEEVIGRVCGGGREGAGKWKGVG